MKKLFYLVFVLGFMLLFNNNVNSQSPEQFDFNHYYLGNEDPVQIEYYSLAIVKVKVTNPNLFDTYNVRVYEEDIFTGETVVYLLDIEYRNRTFAYNKDLLFPYKPNCLYTVKVEAANMVLQYVYVKMKNLY